VRGHHRACGRLGHRGQADTCYQACSGNFGRKILVLCTKGSKSAIAWEFLKEHGIDAYLVDGGLEAWEKAGLHTQAMKFHQYDLTPRRKPGRRYEPRHRGTQPATRQ
ncbi:unnamed protein product, partial [Prorocentrum cordatum]